VELLNRFDSLPEGRNLARSVLLSLKQAYIIASLMDPSQAYLVDINRNLIVQLFGEKAKSVIPPAPGNII
jgi:hypothetical protein